MSGQLVSILKELLSEWGYRSKAPKEGPIRANVKIAIKNAIENRWLLNIYYEGDQENQPGYRWIEPYVWGNNVYSGNEVLRAWQYKEYNGRISTTVPSSTYSKNYPDGWRMFRLDRIKSTAPLTNAHFDVPRDKYHEHDKLMSGIKMAVNFGKNNPQEPPEDEPVDPNAPQGDNPPPADDATGNQAAGNQKEKKPKKPKNGAQDTMDRLQAKTPPKKNLAPIKTTVTGKKKGKTSATSPGGIV